MSYLEDYLDSVGHLPGEISQNYTRIREKDEKSEALIQEIEKDMNTFTQHARTAIKRKQDPSPTLLNEARRLHKQVLDLSEQKIQLAIQTYEVVDSHIRRLDRVIKLFEADLKGQEKQWADARQPIASIAAAAVPAKIAKTAAKPSLRSGGGPATPEKAPARGPSGIAGIISAHLELPVDPDEPRYCTCHRVAFGEMVGCDNPSCPIEWYHFACVGLSAPPKGRWMCKSCTELKKKGLL